MSPQTDHPQITDKLKEILKSNGIMDEVSSVDVRNTDLQGEGMISQTQYATVKFVNPQVKDLNLFLKVHTASPSHSEMIEELKAFEKEAMFLTKYVPAAREFCKSKGMEEFVNFYPKCYYGDKKMIVLENLVLEKGLVMLKKEDLHDLEAATLALKTLAKHDALSYAMIQEAGGEEKFFRQFPNLNYDGRKRPLFAQVCGDSLINNVKSDIKLLEMNDIPGAKEAIVSLKSMERTGLQMVLDSIQHDNDDEELLLLNHGDYWNNNIMFPKNSSLRNIIDCLIIDFQMTNYNVPTLDLSYYLFSSVKTPVRQAHMTNLLNQYLETLKKISKDLGHPFDMSFEKFFTQFRKKFAFGYFWGGICMSCGPGLIVLKDIDMNTVDINEWATFYDKLVNDWIDNHPEEGKRVAEQVVHYVQEYERLLLK